jgi:hypothetical protein
VEFISYVRDRMEAQLHVLITAQNTGAGGEEYSFFFIGLREWEGAQDTLRYVSLPDETEDETRAGLVQTFMLDLVRYVPPTPAGRRLGITYRGPSEQAAVEALDDPRRRDSPRHWRSRLLFNSPGESWRAAVPLILEMGSEPNQTKSEGRRIEDPVVDDEEIWSSPPDFHATQPSPSG